MTRRSHWHIGVAIDGHGSHPGAWRVVADPEPTGLLDGSVATRHALRAEAAGVDFVTLDDALSLGDADESLVRGRVDALLVMAKLGPLTSRIGLIPTVTTTHTEPFHVSKNVATLDWVSSGRCGWRVAVSAREDEADHFGRRGTAPPAALWAEAADAVEVVRRLWDSWEDDAIIRDRSTGRFVDRDKVHYIDFVGERFSVRGPSIVPRSPQGQPLVVVDAVDEHAVAVAAAGADVVLVDAADPTAAATRRTAVLDAVERAGRDPADVTVIANLDVAVAGRGEEAAARLDRLDRFATWVRPAHRPRIVTSAGQLAERLLEWADAVDGVHIHPATLDHDLATFLDEVVPAVHATGLAAPTVEGQTLRDRFALARPTSRYATSRP